MAVSSFFARIIVHLKPKVNVFGDKIVFSLIISFFWPCFGDIADGTSNFGDKEVSWGIA